MKTERIERIIGHEKRACGKGSPRQEFVGQKFARNSEDDLLTGLGPPDRAFASVIPKLPSNSFSRLAIPTLAKQMEYSLSSFFSVAGGLERGLQYP